MPTDLSANIAKILLIEKGELSRSDLASLPWINDSKEVDLIISILLHSLDAEIRQRKIESSIPEWEDYIVLLSKPKTVLIQS